MDTEPSYHRILLSRMKFIGDVVLTTPIIRSVRNAFPDAYIAYLGDAEAVSLLEHNSCLNEIIGFDFARPTLLEQPRVARLLRQRKFDLAIDFFGNPRSALLIFLSGASVRVGPERKGRGRLYTVRVHDDGRPKTAIEFHNQSLRAAGIIPSEVQTEIVLTGDERQAGRELLMSALGVAPDQLKAIIGLHPGATWPAKKWPAEQFGALAHALQEKPGVRVVLTAGPREEDTAFAVQSLASLPLPVLSALPLRSLAAAIAGCDVFVSNDAAPMHISAAVGTPTVGLFGPGEETIWFPYAAGSGHVALRKEVPCHPCHLDFCNRTGNGFMECMKLLSFSEVFAAVERALEHHHPTPLV